MTQFDNDIEHVKMVQEKYADMLLSKPHVIGVSIGQLEEGDQASRLALVVTVEKDVPNDRREPEEQIPEVLDDIPVIIRKVGTITAFTITANAHKQLQENQPPIAK